MCGAQEMGGGPHASGGSFIGRQRSRSNCPCSRSRTRSPQGTAQRASCPTIPSCTRSVIHPPGLPQPFIIAPTKIMQVIKPALKQGNLIHKVRCLCKAPLHYMCNVTSIQLWLFNRVLLFALVGLLLSKSCVFSAQLSENSGDKHRSLDRRFFVGNQHFQLFESCLRLIRPL